MATKTENVEINNDLYKEFIEKISTVDDSEKQELVEEYYPIIVKEYRDVSS